ncbi:MAG: hypothetical protein VCC00_14975 [Deltaproteobacteria bacterium]
MEKTGRGDGLPPGSLEPDSRAWKAFWHWVRAEGGRLMAQYGIREEGEWRAFLADLRESPRPPRNWPPRSH